VSDPHEILGLEAYARALVCLLHARGQPQEQVLATLSTTPSALRRAEQAWSEALADAHARRKGALAMRFAEAFALAQRSIGFSEDATPKVEAPAGRPRVDLPSYLADARPGSAVGSAPGAPSAAAPMAASGGAASMVGAPTIGAPMMGAPMMGAPASGAPPVAAPALVIAAPAAEGGRSPAVDAVVARMMASHGHAGPGGTAGVSLDAPRASAHPWERPAGREPMVGPSELTVEQYASLSAELSRTHDASAVLQRYQVNLPWWQHQQRAWEARLREEPPLLARYQELRRALERRRV
jgi:hypothetical protein